MPSVPDFVLADTAPDGRRAFLDPSADTGAVQAAAGLGKTIDQGAQQITGTALQLQQMKDQADALNASNQFDAAKRGILFGPNGFYSKQGQDAINAAPQVQAQIQSLQKQYQGSLTNPFAQNVFSQTTSYMLNRELDSMSQHVAEQTVAYRNSSITGAMDNSVSNAAFNWNNPNQVTAAFHTVQDGVNQLGASNGWSPQEVQQKSLTATSAAAGQILDYALSKDPAHAGALLQQFNDAHYLDPQSAMAYGNKLRVATSGPVLDGIASAAFDLRPGATGQAAITGAQGDAQWGVESGGKQFGPDGVNPVLSPKGAVGIAQIEPGTAPEAAKAAGLPYDPVRLATDANYNKALGTALMNKYMGQTGGNYPVALAMYNAGPNGAGVQHFAATGDPSQLRDETKTYVAKVENAAGYSPVQAQQTSLDQKGAQLPQLIAAARDQAQTAFPDVPNAPDIAEQKVISKYQEQRSALDDAKNANMDVVSNTIAANKITDPSQILKLGGDVATAYSNLTPDQQQSALALMNKATPGQEVKWSAPAQALHDQLLGQAYTNPAGFAQVNLLDPKIINSLPVDMIKELSNRQQELKGGMAKGVSPSEMDGALSYVTPMLQSAGVVPHNLNGDALKQNPAYQQFAGVMGQDVESYFETNGRMPDAQDLQKIGSRLLVQGSVAGSGNMFFGAKSQMLYQAEGQGGDISKFRATIPAPQLAAINTAYQKVHGQPPDTATATQIYLNMQGAGSGQ
jgi:hypothetical protein